MVQNAKCRKGKAECGPATNGNARVKRSGGCLAWHRRRKAKHGNGVVCQIKAFAR